MILPTIAKKRFISPQGRRDANLEKDWIVKFFLWPIYIWITQHIGLINHSSVELSLSHEMNERSFEDKNDDVTLFTREWDDRICTHCWPHSQDIQTMWLTWIGSRQEWKEWPQSNSQQYVLNDSKSSVAAYTTGILDSILGN